MSISWEHLLIESDKMLDRAILQPFSWTRYQEIAAQMAANPPLNPYELQWFDMIPKLDKEVLLTFCYCLPSRF